MTLDLYTLSLLLTLVTGLAVLLDHFVLARARGQRARILAQEGKSDAAAQARQRPPIVDFAWFCFPFALIVYLLLRVELALLMLLFLCISGVIWLFYRLFWAGWRARRADALAQSGDQETAQQLRTEPVLVEYARSFFPVILVVFLLRSFLVEPFRIPSGSMMPNLSAGDFILVNKFSYGIRLPVFNGKVVPLGDPKRGDVVVFRYPPDPTQNYIKRVVGVPGDRVVYKDKQLTVNGETLEYGTYESYSWHECKTGPNGKEREVEIRGRRRAELLDTVRHDILVLDSSEAAPFDELVPAGHYFMMGDNRDLSSDSRFWGFVPDDHLVGRAFFVWLSVDMSRCDTPLWRRVNWHRIGDSIR